VISPRGIIHGLTVDYNRHCQLEFGSYAQVDEEHDNSMQTRTTGAISLQPTGNAQGGHYFMSLTTGRHLNQNHWTPLPMPQDVIDRVHTLACRSKASRNLQFTWLIGAKFEREYENQDWFDKTKHKSCGGFLTNYTVWMLSKETAGGVIPRSPGICVTKTTCEHAT